MNILFDHQIFELQKIGGISRYFVELFKNLNEIDNVNVEVSTSYSNNIYLEECHNFTNINFQNAKRSLFKNARNKVFRKLNQSNTLYKISKKKYDVFHPTYFSKYYLDKINKPFVLSVFDMIHELYKHDTKISDKTSENKKLLCEKASKIIAISNSTKQDIIDLYDVDPDKIIVTYLAGGFDKPKFNIDHMTLGLPKKYVLFVGSRKWYKNFSRFFDAMVPILQKDKDLHIVCTGGSFNETEINLYEKHDVKDQMISYFCKEEDFYFLYNLAELFVFPSEYEGFGIPTLEAFSADCPAIISNSSSLPEVGGDAALYINPKDTLDIRRKITSVLNDAKLRNSLIEKGRKQIGKFSWKSTAEQTLEVYNMVYNRENK